MKTCKLFDKADLLINTAAMTAAMDVHSGAELLDKWGWGCVELYQAIGEWAEIVTEEGAILWAALEEAGEEARGVFAYEVTEEVGVWIRRGIMEGQEIYHKAVREATRVLIKEFCAGQDLVLRKLP